MSAKSTEKMPSCPSERCLDGVGPSELAVVSGGAPSSHEAGIVSGKLRFRLAATVSGLQWRKSRPLPHSLVEEEEVGEVSGDAACEPFSEAMGLGLAPLCRRIDGKGSRISSSIPFETRETESY